jgi:hypothetical protein
MTAELRSCSERLFDYVQCEGVVDIAIAKASLREFQRARSFFARPAARSRVRYQEPIAAAAIGDIGRAVLVVALGSAPLFRAD